MINDTCTCGAKFSASYHEKYESVSQISESKAHREWLDAHKVCREKQKDQPNGR